MKLLALLAFPALLPMATGPLSAGGDAPKNTLVVALCDGGILSIPLGDRQGDDPEPCHAKGCHAGNCRKQFDPAQRRAR